MNLRDSAAEFQVWLKHVDAQAIRNLVQDALWKHAEPFEKSELVRFFRLELSGQKMIDDGQFKKRLAALKRRFG